MKDPILEMSFAAGIDQAQRPELMDPRTGFHRLENVRAPSVGCVGKRDGFDVHSNHSRVDSSSRSAGYRQFAHGKQTCIIDRDIIDVHAPDDDETISRGRVPDCGLSLMGVPSPPGQTSIHVTDSLAVGAYLVLVATSSSLAAVYACVIERETGQVILPYTSVVTGSAGEIVGRLGARGTTAELFVAEGSSGDIKRSQLDCGSAASIIAGWSAPTTPVSDANGLLAFDVASAGTRCYLAYVNDSAGASQVTVAMYDGGAGGTATINTSSATPTSVGAGVTSGDTLWVAWNESTAVKLCGFSTTDLSTVSATTGSIITAASGTVGIWNISVVPSSTAGAGRLFVGEDDRLQMRNFVTTAGVATASGSQATAYNVIISGVPFRVGSRYYGMCRAYESTGDLVLCDLTESNAWVRPVAYLPPRLSYGMTTARSAAHSSRELWYPFTQQTAGNVRSGRVAKFNFDADARWRAVPYNGVTFLTGGLTSTFDGVRVAETGFLVSPPQPTLATSGSGSFTVTTGLRVVLVYEHVDAAGNWHVSGVSTPSLSSGAFTSKTTLEVTCRPLGISGRISAASDPTVRISAYVTADGGEPPYYYASSVVNKLTAAAQTLNITAAGSGTALLLGTGSLPNTGAQYDRRAPQGLAHLCAYNGFLVGASGEEVFWSSQDVDGEGAWWNDNFSAAVTGGGDITALDTIDGALFVFKRERIYAMAGEPPNDSGTIGGLGAPQRLAVSVGAVSPFTCATEIGIFFVSGRGVELLTRARSVDFIGEKIQDEFAAFPYVSAATYDPVSSCVLIEASSGRSAGLPSGTGRTFVYDLKGRVWRSFDRRAVSGTADVPATDGCMVWQGGAWRYGWLRSDGKSYVETSEHKLDPGDVRVRMYARTGWIHVAGIQGEQHVDRLLLQGEFVENHDLAIGIANDYDDSTFVTETYDSDAVAAWTPVYVVDKDIGQKTGQALMVEIEDAAPTGAAGDSGDGQSARWVALTLTGMGKSGVKRASGVQRGGT